MFRNRISDMEKIYLDYAATTPVDPRVLRFMRPYFADKFGNPGSVHGAGQEAIAAVDLARERVADSLGAEFRQIIFTSSATEANNLVLRGAVKKFRKEFPDRRPKLVVSAIEHESVLETARDLEREGVELAVLPVDKKGIVKIGKLQELLDERTALVSVMYANNEIGTIEPVQEIGKIIADFRKSVRDVKDAQNGKSQRAERSTERSGSTPSTPYPLFHTDAVQAFQYLDCRPEALGADALTISSHKVYGPKGAAALYVKNVGTFKRSNERSDSTLQPIITGGGQEFGLRSGTENVPAIAGFGLAAEIAGKDRAAEAARVSGLRNKFWRELKKMNNQIRLNGVDIIAEPGLRLANNLNIWLPGRPAEETLARLDLAGIRVSAGSACASRAQRASETLKALGYPEKRIKESFRISLGRPTGTRELHQALKIIRKYIAAK